jgi:O-antigen/teichoic acid export membrane protein
MHFGRLEVRQIVATIVGASTGISVAVAGFGAWAIVWQQVAEAITSTLLLWFLAKWRPSLTLSVASLRRLGWFAGNVFGENLLYQAGRNLNNLLIGRFLGAAALGTYALATNVILVPFARIAAPLQQVFFPAFSRMTDDRQRIADVWIRASRLVACVSVPPLAGLILVAPDFVSVALGDKWSEAVPVIQILAVVGMIHSIQTLSGEVLLAVGRADWLLRFTLLSFVAAVVAFAVGVQWGIVGVATSYVVATALVEPVRTWIASRALGISSWRFYAALAGVAQATALMAGALLVTRAALVAAGAQPFARLIVLVLIGAATYVVGCLWRAPELAHELRRVLGRGRPITAAPVPAEPLDARL